MFLLIDCIQFVFELVHFRYLSTLRILGLRILALRSTSRRLPRLAAPVSVQVVVDSLGKLFRFFEQMFLIVVCWILFGEFIQLFNALLHPCRVFEILYYLLDLKFNVHSALGWLLRHLLHGTWLTV